MGLLDRLFGGKGDASDKRGGRVGDELDALAQLDPKWSTETVRRQVRDAFFAVQRSWIERDPKVEEPYCTPELNARQKLRIDGLVSQHRVHQLENPLIEDLDFVSYDQGSETQSGPDRVVVKLDISMVETILDSDSGALVAGAFNHQTRRVQYWNFAWQDKWLLDDVEQPGEGERHMKAPLVGDDYATLSPESILRERYARGEIEIEEFEAEMGKLLGKQQSY
jgi:predicted lipid-binding transport protein (Tim44 family)